MNHDLANLPLPKIEWVICRSGFCIAWARAQSSKEINKKGRRNFFQFVCW
jgi:hypothetical protein